jgi:hypothetical protein
MRTIVLATLGACAGSSGTPTGDSALTGACELAAISQSCPSCSDGPYTCTYGEVTVTRGSCGECQVRGALYSALCEAGETDTADQIEVGAVCAPDP